MASRCLQEFAVRGFVAENRDVNLSQLLRETAARVPDKPAFLWGGQTITFEELDRQVDRAATWLKSRGVAVGDRVAIGMQNLPHFAYSYFGALRLGAVAVPLNPLLAQVEVERVLADSGARVAIAAPPFYDVLARAASDGFTVLSTEDWEGLPEGERIVDFDAGHEDLAALPYTSGTTGEPKGVMLSHGNLRANLDQQMRVPGARIEEDDVLFVALPLFHIFGLNVILGLLVMNGATGVLMERFEPVQALKLIQEHKVTVLFGAPPMYTAWLNTPGAEQYDLSSVRLAISGAAPLATETLEAFQSVFAVTIYEGYGLTETAPTLTSNRMTGAARPGSVGRALPDVEIRLITPQGNDVEIGDPGEVVVRGPNVFQGYWKREKETAAAFIGDWFRTGDVGVLDEDGYLYLVDRKRDLIIVSGFNVFPAEVELALNHNAKVQESAVVGVPHPYTGEAIKAYVVLEPGVSATEVELIADAHTRLARFKCPETIEIVDELPHLLTGKVLRRALRT